MDKIAVAQELLKVAKDLIADERPWSPAMMKSWVDYINSPLSVVVKNVDTLKKIQRVLLSHGMNPANAMINMSNIQELLDEVIEQANYTKTHTYGAMDYTAKYLKDDGSSI